MRVLIMMLFNLKTETYHPIFYFEHPFPSGSDDILRFRSKGHRTVGFKNRDEALATIEPEIISQLPGYSIVKELDEDLPWDGENIPADNQLRSKEWELKNFS